MSSSNPSAQPAPGVQLHPLLQAQSTFRSPSSDIILDNLISEAINRRFTSDDAPESTRELQSRNCNQDTLITELRIRAAVLENDLSHTRTQNQEGLNVISCLKNDISLLQKEKTAALSKISVLEADLAYAKKEKIDAVNSSVVIARALGGVVKESEKQKWSAAEEEIEELRGEVRRLKRENSMLWGRIEGARAAGIREFDEERRGEDRVASAPAPPVEVENPRDPKMVVERILATDWNDDDDDEDVHEMAQDGTGLSSASEVELGASNSTPPPKLFKPNQSNADVGIVDLDDILDDSEDNVSVQLATAEADLATLKDIIPPTVLKTGFDNNKGLRGENYANRRENGQGQGFDRSHAPVHGNASLLIGPDGIWGSAEERDDEISTHFTVNRGGGLPTYFKYGVKYTPAEGDKDVYRSVLISNLPRDIELKDVLARVRGGQIISSILANGVVMVMFVKQEAAEDYVAYTSQYPVIFGEGESKSHAVITLLSTPTFPLPGGKLNLIYRHQSRHVCIPNLPPQFSVGRLELDLATQNGFRGAGLLEIYIDDEETLHLEFNTIDNAVFTYNILTKWPGYRGLRICFQEDPSARPLEDLLLPIVPKKPIPAERREIHEGVFPANLNYRGAVDEKESSTDEGSPGVLTQRKRLAALQNRQAAVPEFNGKGLEDPFWANEVIAGSGTAAVPKVVTGEEATVMRGVYAIAPPNSPASEVIDLESIDSAISNIKEEHFHTPRFTGPTTSPVISGYQGDENGMVGMVRLRSGSLVKASPRVIDQKEALRQFMLEEEQLARGAKSVSFTDSESSSSKDKPAVLGMPDKTVYFTKGNANQAILDSRSTSFSSPLSQAITPEKSNQNMFIPAAAPSPTPSNALLDSLTQVMESNPTIPPNGIPRNEREAKIIGDNGLMLRLPPPLDEEVDGRVMGIVGGEATGAKGKINPDEIELDDDDDSGGEEEYRDLEDDD